jgi:hypothetical protein
MTTSARRGRASLAVALSALALAAVACGSDDPATGTATGPSATASGTAATSRGGAAGSGTASSAPSRPSASSASTAPSGATPRTDRPPSLPPSAPVNGSQKSVLDSLPGSTGSSCVQVGSQRDVRSGGVAVGNFADARKQYASQPGKEQPAVTMYVIPSSTAATKATIQLAPVGHAGTTKTFSTSSVQKADEWNYFSVAMTVPSAGSWRLTATAGKDTGCFVVTFG